MAVHTRTITITILSSENYWYRWNCSQSDFSTTMQRYFNIWPVTACLHLASLVRIFNFTQDYWVNMDEERLDSRRSKNPIIDQSHQIPLCVAALHECTHSFLFLLPFRCSNKYNIRNSSSLSLPGVTCIHLYHVPRLNKSDAAGFPAKTAFLKYLSLTVPNDLQQQVSVQCDQSSYNYTYVSL